MIPTLALTRTAGASRSTSRGTADSTDPHPEPEADLDPYAGPDTNGRRVSKHFPGHGRFHGEVVARDEEHAGYTVRYEDGDVECVGEEEVSKPMRLP